MSLAILKSCKFSSEIELCNFVNDNEIAVIEQIIADDYGYVLFYR